MLLIPAIDLKDGRCVRLRQGRMEDATLFSDDPVATAQRWVSAGAERLHLVDLNGAFAGTPLNNKAITAIANTFPELTIQIGGGIRNLNTIENYIDIGVNYVIIGTQAVVDPEFIATACDKFPGHIIVGLDAKAGRVAINGWATVTEHLAVDLAQKLSKQGVTAIVYTDINRDGMLTGPNLIETDILAKSVDIPVIASGGITNIEDVKALVTLANPNIIGAITGRAIYEGTLDFSHGRRLALGLDP
ncbi:1-(5-phosphoribosyl)-5-[(5-phosphoribosylamino)methylideneamino] imidazole-4-carboxamide isomerase [Achromatium sp. WMS2]|nr:1-(5-phosphoribosyl)-5-[(5-phosphoribosylamino)methylideneamino] imidazole-4-carboxamide isomerase [Achromatium sp. WMS2]